MAYNTENLGLFCYDTDIDSGDVFSIDQALNDNWVIIDNSIPTKTSQLTNDSGFLTEHQSLSNYCTLNSAQTISGNKTFTGTTKVPNSATVGTAVSTAGISKATNGYVKFGNGIIVQWININWSSGDVTKTGTVEKNISFPTAFTTTNWSGSHICNSTCFVPNITGSKANGCTLGYGNRSESTHTFSKVFGVFIGY